MVYKIYLLKDKTPEFKSQDSTSVITKGTYSTPHNYLTESSKSPASS